MQENRPLITIGSYTFTPHWFPTLVTIVLLPILIALGCWQLERAAEKTILQANYQMRGNATPINLNQVSQLPKDIQFYAVQVTGHFDNAHSFLLDNKFYQDQIGYQVLTPFLFVNKNAKTKIQTVLINRGWIPQGASREQLPTIQAVTAKLTLQGIIAVPDKKDFILGHETENNLWPRRIEKIELGKMAGMAQQQLYPFFILLASDQPAGFVREWAPFNGKISVHYGYAFQWFALALALFVIFIAVNTRKKKEN